MPSSSIQSAVHPTAEQARAHIDGIVSSYGRGQQVKIVSVDIQETEGGWVAVASIDMTELEVQDEKKDQEQASGDSESEGKGTGDAAGPVEEDALLQDFDEPPPVPVKEDESLIPQAVDMEQVQKEIESGGNFMPLYIDLGTSEQQTPSSESTLQPEEREQINDMAEKLKSEFEQAQNEEDEPAPEPQENVVYVHTHDKDAPEPQTEDEREEEERKRQEEEIRRLNHDLLVAQMEDLTPAA